MIGFAEEIDYEPAPSVAPPPLIIDYKYKAIAGSIGEKGSIRSGTEPGSGELDKSRTKKRKTEPTSRPRETDEIRLAGRQKQIDYGKNTIGYEKYLATIPKYHHRNCSSLPRPTNSCRTPVERTVSKTILVLQISIRYAVNAAGMDRSVSGVVYCIASTLSSNSRIV